MYIPWVKAAQLFKDGQYDEALEVYIDLFHNKKFRGSTFYILLLKLRLNKLEGFKMYYKDGMEYTQASTRFFILDEIFETYQTADPVVIEEFKNDLIDCTDNEDHPLIEDVLDSLHIIARDRNTQNMLDED